MAKSTLMFWAIFGLAVILPKVILVVTVAVLTMQTVLILVRLGARVSAGSSPKTQGRDVCPVFSVHVAIHNEPPILVNATLHALFRQEFPSDRVEIIVIDNNTTNPALWSPVERECSLLGDRFRFLHREGVIGAKAGALNIALDHARPDATHIVTIDADYLVQPNFLADAERALRRTGADYVQFPQAYRRTDSIAQGVDIELEEYFRSEARMADDAEAVLLTGTLCVISKAALLCVGGWSGRTTTEDAELGVRLCKGGFTGRYIPKVVGNGLLPLTLTDLLKQRYRWTSGNLRTLVLYLPNLLWHSGALRTRQVVAIIAQLGAWLNFGLVPAAALLATALFNPAFTVLMTVAAVSILLALGDIISRLMTRSIKETESLALGVAAITSRLALAPAAARATADACFSSTQKFIVTRKFASSHNCHSHVPLDHMVLFALALSALWNVRELSLTIQLGVGALTLPLPAAWWVTEQLTRYRSVAFHTPDAKEISA